MWLGQPARAPATLLEAAESLRPYDLAAARGMVLETMRAAVFAGRYAIDADLTAVARAALAMPLPPATSPNVDDLLLDGSRPGSLASIRWPRRSCGAHSRS